MNDEEYSTREKLLLKSPKYILLSGFVLIVVWAITGLRHNAILLVGMFSPVIAAVVYMAPVLYVIGKLEE